MYISRHTWESSIFGRQRGLRRIIIRQVSAGPNILLHNMCSCRNSKIRSAPRYIVTSKRTNPQRISIAIQHVLRFLFFILLCVLFNFE